MPEGDTIHKVAAAMAPRLEGMRLARMEFAPRHGPAPPPGTVERVRAHGKHLLLDLEGGRSVRVHLGMYGSWHRYAPGEAWRKPARRASIVLETGNDVFVCFSARELEVMRTPGIGERNLFNRLGPDLLAGEADPGVISRRAREFNAAGTPLPDVLLDQRVACGIGNVYKSEVLFLLGVHPGRQLADASDALLADLFAAGADLLSRNLGGGRRVTRFVDDGRGRLWVYGRTGAPCLRCDDPSVIRREALGRGARATFWCPACQQE